MKPISYVKYLYFCNRHCEVVWMSTCIYFVLSSLCPYTCSSLCVYIWNFQKGLNSTGKQYQQNPMKVGPSVVVPLINGTNRHHLIIIYNMLRKMHINLSMSPHLIIKLTLTISQPLVSSLRQWIYCGLLMKLFQVNTLSVLMRNETWTQICWTEDYVGLYCFLSGRRCKCFSDLF